MIADPQAITRIERLRERSPGAVELATYASLAVLIEPELLRALRLTVAPHLEVGAEADLWLSRLVDARSHEAMTLQPAVAAVLRDALRDRVDRDVARRAWRTVQAVHVNTSPAIAHEEALAWLTIDGTAADVEEALKSALRTLVEQPERGLASWWMRARARLPDGARRTRVADALDRRAMLALGRGDTQGRSSAGSDFEDLLRLAGDSVVYVRRGHSALEIGEFEPDATTMSIRVPDVDPVRVEVSGDDSAAAVLVSLAPGGSEIVPARSDIARIKTERGDVYELRRDARPPVESELLPLARILQAALGAIATTPTETPEPGDALLRALAPQIETVVGEVVDPPWRRGLRALAERLEIDESSGFSTFSNACVALAVRETRNSVHRSSLRRAATRLLPRLAPYDHIARGHPAPDDPQTRKRAGTLARAIADALPAGDPIAKTGEWILAQIQPRWLALQDPVPDNRADDALTEQAARKPRRQKTRKKTSKRPTARQKRKK